MTGATTEEIAEINILYNQIFNPYVGINNLHTGFLMKQYMELKAVNQNYFLILTLGKLTDPHLTLDLWHIL
jgi:hypothetical protein